MTFKFGDKVVNKSAGDENPRKYGIVVRVNGEWVLCTDGNGDFFEAHKRSLALNQATTNQPTDATPVVSPKIMAQHFEVAVDLAKEVQHLTAQLAVEQAKAKAWEADASRMRDALESIRTIQIDYVELLDPRTGEVAKRHVETAAARIADDALTPKPQPVDAESLARIARVALETTRWKHMLKLYAWGGQIEERVDALTPNDIALAQALAGGA